MFHWSVVDVKVTVCFCFFFFVFFLMLNTTIPLTCTLANEYPSSNEISKKMVWCEGIASLAMPYFYLRMRDWFVDQTDSNFYSCSYLEQSSSVPSWYIDTGNSKNRAIIIIIIASPHNSKSCERNVILNERNSNL